MSPSLIALAASVMPLVTHGGVDAGDPAVVAIVTETGVTECSGTVIDAHFVLTAAHCIVPQIASGARVLVGSSVEAPTVSVPIAAFRVHPGYDPGTFADDAAIVVLGSALSVAPVPLTRAPAVVGSPVRVVGWGLTATGASGIGTKRTGTAIVTSVDALSFRVGPDPSQPCTGDSGGPGLVTVEGQESLAGITSHGDSACASEATYTRVDAVTADFVSPTLAALGPGSAGIGARCLYPEQCGQGASACLTAPDQPGLAYCTGPCSVNADCPGGMLCVEKDPGGSECRFAVPTPGAFGGRCQVDADCVAGVCAGGACTVSCVPEGNGCPGASVCQEQGNGIEFFCVPTSGAQAAGSACALASRVHGHEAVLAFFAALGALTGIRRRRTPEAMSP